MIPDKDRKPLSGREYYALRELFGIVSLFNVHADELEKRVRSIPGGWRDLRLIMTLSEKLMQNILNTIPLKKLGMISKELKHTTCEVKVSMPGLGRKEEGFCYVPEQALVDVVSRVVEFECLFCEKRGVQAKQCKCRKELEVVYPWDFPLKGDVCPLAHKTITLEDDENDE